MQDLKETFSTVSTFNKDDNIHPQENSTEGGERVLDEKMNLAAKYGIDVSTLDFSINDLSLEELTAKFESMKKDNINPEPEDKFALISNVIDEINRVLRLKR